MFTKVFIIISLISFIFTKAASGHPTSFKDSVIIDSRFSQPMSEIGIGYSATHRIAFWGKSLAFNFAGPAHSTNLQINYLVQRWNQIESQGNVYVGLGYGQWTNRMVTPLARELHYYFLQADWETRYIYFMIEHYGFQSKSLNNMMMNKYRFGFAPYTVDFEAMSSWIIYEGFDQINQSIDHRMLLRMYYKNVLFEIGGSLNGYAIINLMTHI